jgi:hypothetical protein
MNIFRSLVNVQGIFTTKVELLDFTDLNVKSIVNTTFRFFNQLTTYTTHCVILDDHQEPSFFFGKTSCTCRMYMRRRIYKTPHAVYQRIADTIFRMLQTYMKFNLYQTHRRAGQ